MQPADRPNRLSYMLNTGRTAVSANQRNSRSAKAVLT